MTTEEKAKAYDKAIEKIKYVMEHGVQPVLNKEDLQDIFPELKESNDERIRKEILEFVTIVADSKSNKMEWITWLEKQAPKPKWGEEDEGMMNHCIGAIHIAGCHVTNSYTAKDKKAMKDWLKSLKQRLGGEQ